MRADLLASAPDGFDEAIAAVDAFDQALVAGLVRPQPAQAAGLAHLAEAVAGTPLASRVAEAADKAAAGVAGEDHFVALAAARTALLGAAHDALMAQVQEATGRSASAAEDAQATGSEAAENLLAAARSWLSDLARTGWQGLDSDVVAGSAQVLAAMLPNLHLRRLAVLLDGFAAELAASCPGATMERFPARRWADLWSRALLLTLPGGLAAAATEKATGRLLPLGIDLQEHATAVQVQVHAVFEPADSTGSQSTGSQSTGPRLVRASVSAPKPDTVIGAGLWQLLRPHMSLLSAASEGRAMELTDMPLTVEGDLIWSDSHARRGDPADPFATARVVLPTAADAPTGPLGRHPARIAVPVFLEGYAVGEDDGALTLTVAGHPLTVDADRIPVAGPLTPKAIAASGACIALLRWDDGEFRVQPLAVETTVKKKVVAIHAGTWAGGTTDKDGVKAEKAATEAIVVLVERAGRLLRK
jgi:hypothetical protein